MRTSLRNPAGRAHAVTVQIDETAPASSAEYPNCYRVIPPNGRRCDFTGLGHAKLYQVLGPNGVARPYVRVANLRTPGTARGQTLFHVGDMLRFLDGLAQESTPSSASAAANN